MENIEAYKKLEEMLTNSKKDKAYILLGNYHYIESIDGTESMGLPKDFYGIYIAGKCKIKEIVCSFPNPNEYDLKNAQKVGKDIGEFIKKQGIATYEIVNGVRIDDKNKLIPVDDIDSLKLNALEKVLLETLNL